MGKLKVLDLFSGIGGFSLGLERTGGFETVAFCEIEPFCQKVLKKHWPEVPIFEDVRTLDYEGSVDVITGGFPCQPFSCAGNQDAEKDDRHLWPEMLRTIVKHKPRWIIGENVTGIIKLALDNICSSLEAGGYTVRTFVIPACAVNAPHRRDRVWIVGHSTELFSNGSKHNTASIDGQIPKSGSSGGKMAISNSQRREREVGWKAGRNGREWKSFPANGGWQGKVKPFLDRKNDGLPHRLDRLRSLGNAVVPQIPEIIGDAILQSLDGQ